MTAQQPDGASRLDRNQRLTAYQTKLRTLKERSSLREVMERELLLEFIKVNHGAINEYPLLQAQQKGVVELLCARIGHPGYDYIQERIANFIVLLAHYEKAVKVDDQDRVAELESQLINTESLLLKCVQGIVYAMALVTDNFEEIVLRYFGQESLREYSKLIEEFELDERFWKAFVEQFIASRVDEAHAEMIEGGRFDVNKEGNFLVIRFLFDDILAKLNPTDQKIEKTRIQKRYVATREEVKGRMQAKFVNTILAKGFSELPGADRLTKMEMAQASRIACIDPVAGDFEAAYRQRALDAKARQDNPDAPDDRDPEAVRRDNVEFKFLMDQLVAIGVGTAIAIGKTSDHFYRALEEFVPDEMEAIAPLARDFSISALEKILYFLLENHAIHILKETGREEGGKIQVRSGRARRVPEAAVDALPGMTKIRKKQLFGNDVTREGTLLFKPKTAQQTASAMSMLSLEPELAKGVTELWKNAIFRVDIMVLVNLEQVARTTTNLKAKLADILDKYGVARKPAPPAQTDA